MRVGMVVIHGAFLEGDKVGVYSEFGDFRPVTMTLPSV